MLCQSLNMADIGSHLKKNARALGCDMVDFKPQLLPESEQLLICDAR